MKLLPVAPLAKQLVRASVRRVSGLTRSFRLSKESLLFLFGENTIHWPGMGRALYHQEPVFRDSVQASCQLLTEFSGQELVSYFDAPLDADLAPTTDRASFVRLAVQLGLADLWMAKGVLPDATLGKGLGEVAAAYAAGGLTRRDAARIYACWLSVHSREVSSYVSVLLEAGSARAKALCRACPVSLYIVYEATAQSVITLHHSRDSQQVKAFLDENAVNWTELLPERTKPFHTPLFRSHYQAIWNQLNQIDPQPLQRDFYSSTLGALIPKQAVIDTNVWYESLCSPVLFYPTIQAAISDGYTIMTPVGPPTFFAVSAHKSVFRLPSTTRLFESMRPGTNEIQQFRSTFQQLRRIPRQTKQVVIRRDGAAAPLSLLPKLNLLADATVQHAPSVFAYLRSQHRICFLPLHKAWFVLHHDEATHILRRSDLFTTGTCRVAAPFALPADLASQTTQIRLLLLPLFSPQAIAGLRGALVSEVNHRLDSLVIRSTFDVVNELAIPLTQSIMRQLLGLRPMEAELMQASLTGHLYELRYLAELEQFFQRYLQQRPTAGGSQMGDLLIKQIRGGRLASATAASLMRLTWTAGTLLTSMTLTSLINALVRQPHLTDQLKRDETLIPAFVNEGMRLEPAEVTLRRVVTQSTSLAGQRLPAGSQVLVSLLAANRDPQVFAAPNEWNLHRPAHQPIAVSEELHQWLGATMIRLVAQVVVEAVIRRMPDVRLVDAPPVYYASTSLRGLAKLTVSPS